METNEHPALFNNLKYVFGSIGTVLWSFQLLPQVHKNWRNRSTEAIDMLGAAFSALSLAFYPPPFDALAASCYFTIFTLDLIIIILYYLLNLMHKKNSIDYNNREDSNPSNDEIIETIIDDKLNEN
ncbi:769_t:CDS:2, partial [Dentiscutata erythropus]